MCVDCLSAAGDGRAIQDVNQKLRVCEVCGAFLSISDNDRRLADHFGGESVRQPHHVRGRSSVMRQKSCHSCGVRRQLDCDVIWISVSCACLWATGKLHLGYVQIRDKLKVGKKAQKGLSRRTSSNST